MIKPTKKYSIDIAVEKQFINEESDPQKNQYVFAYIITISNRSAVKTQLLRRHWWITNAVGKEIEVEGEGVVGEQPVIAPGDSYTYTSGTVIDTPVGTMHGHYEMKSETGDLLKVKIPSFTLAAPGALH